MLNSKLDQINNKIRSYPVLCRDLHHNTLTIILFSDEYNGTIVLGVGLGKQVKFNQPCTDVERWEVCMSNLVIKLSNSDAN